MPDKTDTLWNVVRKYRNWLALVTALLLLFLSWAATYFLSASPWGVEVKAASLAVVAALINLASTATVFVVASVLFAREDAANWGDAIRRAVSEAQDRPTDLAQVRWQTLIDNAHSIDFVVQGWNGWAEQHAIALALTRFFERGGTFRLYVCNPESQAATMNRSAMEKRLGRNPGHVIEEIKGTSQRIGECLELAKRHTVDQVKVFETDELNWYFAALFRGREVTGQVREPDVLILSIYSHTPGRRPWNMPAIQVHPDQYHLLSEWFEKELEHLRNGAGRRIPDSATTTLTKGNSIP